VKLCIHFQQDRDATNLYIYIFTGFYAMRVGSAIVGTAIVGTESLSPIVAKE